MSQKVIICCDICHEEIVGYVSHVKYRYYGPSGLEGEKLDLCRKHAGEFNQWLKAYKQSTPKVG